MGFETKAELNQHYTQPEHVSLDLISTYVIPVIITDMAYVNQTFFASDCKGGRTEEGLGYAPKNRGKGKSIES